MPAKRKQKQQQCEAAKDKVPHDVRQRYVNMFTEEFLKTAANVNDAFEKVSTSQTWSSQGALVWMFDVLRSLRW